MGFLVMRTVASAPADDEKLQADVLFSVYAPPGIDTEYIQTDLRQLERWIVELSPSAHTELIQVI